MRILIDPDEGDMFELDWPADWRLPCVGEFFEDGPQSWLVESVHFQLDQDGVNAVQLAVTPL